MRKKSSNQKLKSLRVEIEGKTKFWQPVVRNGWWIKFSVYRDHFILLTFISRYTGQTVIRYYTSEEEAIAYINFITTCNAQDIVQSA